MKNELKFSWREIGDAYQSFSTMSDEGDWQSIISQIAAVISKSATETRKILDFGAGLGSTAASIRRQLYGVHGLLSSWFLYEPDALARSAHPILMPSVGERMFVHTLDKRPTNTRFDVVLFIHTSYYVSKFDDEIKRFFDPNLGLNEGFLICISMPKESPFFIPEINNINPWAAQDIVEVCSNLGLRYETIRLRSRFRWTAGLMKDKVLSQKIASFVCGGRAVSNNEIRLVEEKLSGEIDFGDWMIVIRR